jgi:hypothetical protein
MNHQLLLCSGDLLFRMFSSRHYVQGPNATGAKSGHSCMA